MKLSSLVTAKTTAGGRSWTVIAAWLMILVGAADQLLAQQLIPAEYVGVVVVVLGVLKLALRGKTVGPLA